MNSNTAFAMQRSGTGPTQQLTVQLDGAQLADVRHALGGDDVRLVLLRVEDDRDRRKEVLGTGRLVYTGQDCVEVAQSCSGPLGCPVPALVNDEMFDLELVFTPRERGSGISAVNPFCDTMMSMGAVLGVDVCEHPLYVVFQHEHRSPRARVPCGARGIQGPGGQLHGDDEYQLAVHQLLGDRKVCAAMRRDRVLPLRV